MSSRSRSAAEAAMAARPIGRNKRSTTISRTASFPATSPRHGNWSADEVETVASSADSIRHALWPATVREKRPQSDRFEEGLSVEIAIIGGGFTGCSAALAAAGAGASVALLEARTIGWGASGRNGGQVIPGLKLDPQDMEENYGKEAGARLAE